MLMTGNSDFLAKTVARSLPAIHWRYQQVSPESVPQLSPGIIHLWRSPLSMPRDWFAQHEFMLSSDEQERAQRFKFDHHRLRFTAARCRLRQLLAAYLAIAPEQVQFCYGSHGKPTLVPVLQSQQSALSFNLTHTDDLALYAFTLGCAIGVDIERIRPMPEGVQIAQRFFTPSESEAIAHCTSGKNDSVERDDAFFTLWTLKEAYLKAKGEGLVGLQSASLVLTSRGSNPFEGWTLQSFSPISGYQGAIAYEGRKARIHFFDVEAAIREPD